LFDLALRLSLIWDMDSTAVDPFSGIQAPSKRFIIRNSEGLILKNGVHLSKDCVTYFRALSELYSTIFAVVRRPWITQVPIETLM